MEKQEEEVAKPVSVDEGAQAQPEPAKVCITAQSDAAPLVPFNLRLYAHIDTLVYCRSGSTTDLAKEVDGLTLASPVPIPQALESDTQALREAAPDLPVPTPIAAAA